jgi:hypothetical protein
MPRRALFGLALLSGCYAQADQSLKLGQQQSVEQLEIQHLQEEEQQIREELQKDFEQVQLDMLSRCSCRPLR